MERLTTEDHELIGCHGCEEKGVCYARYWCSEKKKALIELKRYEDTGLTPPEIMKLKERDKPRKIELNAGAPICSVCGRRIVKCYNFCPDCGQRLKHKEERRWNENLKRH